MATRVLVCGATGFIGRNLVERLVARAGVELHAVRFTREAYPIEGVRWHQADLREASVVARLAKGMDVVIQAAATTSGSGEIVNRPHIHITDNALMNSLLLRECFENKVGHFVFFSCSVMYQPRVEPWREEEWDAGDEFHPHYFGSGWTKVYIEKMCEFFARHGMTKHTVIRHTNVYGPHDKFDLQRSHVVGATVTKAMTSRDGTVSVWGSGEEARDLVYVDDLVDFVERALDRQTTRYEMVHVSAGRAISVNDIVRQTIEASGRTLRIVHDPRGPTIRTSFSLDNGYAARAFGWRPTVDFPEGIRRTIDWWRGNHGVG